MATTELIRYITDQSTSISLGNQTCYTKPSIWLVYDDDGPSGEFGAIMKVSPPNINMEYEQVSLKYNETFDYVTGGEVTLDDIELIDGDKVWLSNQSVPSENGIYYVRTGTWDLYRVVDTDVFVDLGARSQDTVDGNLTRQIITEQNINFNEVGFYTINYYVINSQGILSHIKRKVKVIREGASIVPTDTYAITDYQIIAEVDTELLDPDNILDSCNACELEGGGNIGDQILDGNDSGSGPAPGNNTTFIRSDGTIKFIDNQSMGGNNLTDIADPVNPTDAVNLRTLEEFVRSSDTIGNNYTAGEDLMLHRVVYIHTDGNVYEADSSDITQMNKIIGVTIDNTIADDSIPVVTIGTIDGFTGLNIGNEYFVSSSGALTHIPPTTGFTQVMGVAVSVTELLVNMQVPLGV